MNGFFFFLKSKQKKFREQETMYTTKGGHDNKKIWNHWPRVEQVVVP